MKSRTCGAQFVNIFCTKSSHTSCPMDNWDYWSCSFLSKILDITPSLFSFKVCRLCGIQIHCEADNPESGKILDHLITKHNIRGCNQRLFIRQEEFQSHLVTEHSACFGESFVPWLVHTDVMSDSYRREFQSLPQIRRHYLGSITATSSQKAMPPITLLNAETI